MHREKISIIVADELTFYREGMVAALESENGYKVVGEAKNGEEVIEKTNRLKPDLAIIDIGLPLVNGIEATDAIKKLGIVSEVIALSFNTDDSIIIKMLQAGAMGYLEKNIARHELYKAIESVVIDRRMYFPESTSKRMFQLLQKTSLNPLHNPEMLFSETEKKLFSWFVRIVQMRRLESNWKLVNEQLKGIVNAL